MAAFTPSTIAALVIAASFAAGLNVYATVMTLGLLAHWHWVVLPSGLEVLGDGWVIAASGAMFALEFVADKIPGVDLIWNALHTFIRVPVAGLIAYRATAHLSPQMQLLATVGGALIALAAHGSKTAVRAIVTPSPEPVSNIALSSGEDAIADRIDVVRHAPSMDRRGDCDRTDSAGSGDGAMDGKDAAQNGEKNGPAQDCFPTTLERACESVPLI